MTERALLEPRGPFSLQAAAEFGFGPHRGDAFTGVMRLAFPVDGGGYAGAVLRQPQPDAVVEVELHVRAGAEPQRALTQVARILSLDHDGEEFLRVGREDPVLATLQREHPGQRPVLFHSPYEAAAWSIISARRPAAQGARVRGALSERWGESFPLDGVPWHAFPQPERLAELPGEVPGLSAEKVERLRGVALAALEGELEVQRLQRLGPEQAHVELQRLKGLGPFYAGLVVLRATGFADAPLMVAEPKVMAHAARLYGLEAPVTLERFGQLAERWRPFRIWATVLIRLGGDRAAGVGLPAAG